MLSSSSSSARAVWSIPNLLTYGRIVIVPLVVACLYIGTDFFRWTALALYTIAAISDFLDGYLARRWAEVSPLGRMLDPIADKLLIAACLLMLVAVGSISGPSVIAAVIILCREMLVSGLREFLAEGHVKMPVSQLAKWKTAFQLVALGFLVVGPAGDHVFAYNTLCGVSLLWVSALLTLYTGWDYMRTSIGHVLKGD